jgi:hypothetical protein
VLATRLFGATKLTARVTRQRHHGLLNIISHYCLPPPRSDQLRTNTRLLLS